MGDSILIIGGVAAGLSAASRARRVSASASITVLERGPVAAYGACGLPQVLAGELAPEKLIAHPAGFFHDQRQIEVRTAHEVLAIEPARRRVRVLTPQGEAWFGYDRLVVATGATGRWRPLAPAGGWRNLFSANTWAQAQALLAALRGPEAPRRVAVVGGGYIGVETAEALARRGLEVTLIAAGATLVPALDPELGEALAPLAAGAGIAVRTGVRVLGLEGAGRVRELATSAGPIATDAVINCGGLRPEAGLAAAAGAALGPTGAIAVDERQQTSLPAVLAAGDCCEARHLVSGAPTWMPLAPAASRQGRVAGQNAAGGPPARFPGVLGTLAVPLFGWEWGRTGLGLARARAAGFDAAAVEITAAGRAGYLAPMPVTVRLVWQPSSGRLLGCQMRGAPGAVAGRLAAAAVALTARMTLDQLDQLDFAFAPALSPLHDPLAIAARQARKSG